MYLAVAQIAKEKENLSNKHKRLKSKNDLILSKTRNCCQKHIILFAVQNLPIGDPKYMKPLIFFLHLTRSSLVSTWIFLWKKHRYKIQ